MKEFKYVVTDPEGIHARPAGILVKQAAGYTSSVKITKGDKTADAKRIFGVIGAWRKNRRRSYDYSRR